MKTLVEWLARRARPQYRLAIVLIVWWPVFLLMMYGLGWVLIGIDRLAGEQGRIRFGIVALTSGLAVVGEWARACVKVTLRKAPGEGSLLATAIAGAVVGALFDAYLILMWGNDGWREVVLTAAIAAGLYVVIDLCLRWDARAKARR